MSLNKIVTCAALVGSVMSGNAMAADSRCPGSKAWFTHAKTELDVTFSSNSCEDVKSVIVNRAGGSQNGQWVDPHNKGTYTVLSSDGDVVELQRETGNGKYKDLMTFTLSASVDGGCNVFACSESQVTSVKDFSTNYCNLHDLYCSDAGCNALAGEKALAYDEKITECSSGQHSTSDCYKTTNVESAFLSADDDDVDLYEIKDGVCGQTTIDKKYESYAEKFNGNLKEGTCADQGYTVADGTQTFKVPFLGDITVSKFTKPSPIVLLRGNSECKPVDTQDDFDLDAYISKRWYIQQQMPTKYLPKEQNFCVYAEYTKMEKNSFWGYSVQVHNYAQEADGTKHDSKKIICAAVDTAYNTDARLQVGLCKLPRWKGVTTGPYWVVSYDEAKGYALVSGGQPTVQTSEGCKTGSGVNNAGLWIFTRKQERDQSLVDEVRAIAESKGFDLSVLNDVDQTNC